MCGIAGFWCGKLQQEPTEVIRKITEPLHHRGPNDTGYWVDAGEGVAFGHKRLSIIDLSQSGHQPMLSHSQRYVIVYNGEIYNFKEIREKIDLAAGHAVLYRGSSDTEVILTAIEQFGLKKALECFVGMFAFALYDRETKTLHLARDRIGEKPLYYGMVNNAALVFASELKAIRNFPGFQNELNPDALALYFKYNYIPTPLSIYKNIYKLEPGTLLTIPNPVGEWPKPEAYWSFSSIAESGTYSHLQDNAETLAELEGLLKRSIKGQMIADVPLGAFLSGGIDSSLIVSLMQAQSSLPVKTFTIGFNERGYNEAEEAKKVAKHLNTEHTELYVSPREAMEVIPQLMTLYDEPFSDSSQIPTYLVSKLARQHVAVSLSGDAGDELFGGYNRYFMTEKIWGRISRIPRGGRHILAKLMRILPPGAWDGIYKVASLPLPGKEKYKLFGDKIHKLSSVIESRGIADIYDRLTSHWVEAFDLVAGSKECVVRSDFNKFNDNRLNMMFLDSIAYLPDDILVKVDRAAMGVSLETRVPFLDHRLVEYAWRLPLSMKFRNGKGKWALRQILAKYVPNELIERPKMGFGVPIGDWMRSDLKEWAYALINKEKLKSEGLLDEKMVSQKWDEHQSGHYNWQYYLWDVIVFESWLENVTKTK